MADYSAEQRQKMLKQGKALPPKGDGPPRFPIDTVSDVTSAINQARTPEERAHTYKHALRLGAAGKVPAHWKPDGSLRSK